MYKVVHKPWGKEEWLELNDSYCYKRIYINAGYKTSFQYHKLKRETNYIIDGTAEVWLENDDGVVEKKTMKAGDFFNVVPPRKHRVIAITDIILQEVSTPHVDDVVRIDDEFSRNDGKIDAEHKTPAVLILAAGTGSRLKDLTKSVNKAMLPINNRAIISHILEKFPNEYDVVVALGYKGDSLREYCELAHPERKFTFVNVDKIEGPGSGPGYSATCCKNYLQRPFYFVVADCVVDSKIPHLDGNWIGVYPTSYPEKYSTAKLDSHNNVIDFMNKDAAGYDNAFIGLASIWDYDVFWKALESSDNGEIVSAFKDVSKYKNFKAKHLKWFDTGNLDDLNKAKQSFKDSPLSLRKETDEITFKERRFMKYNPDMSVVTNISKRAAALQTLIPTNFLNTKHFISYEWEPGQTVYSYDSTEIYNNFLNFFDNTIKSSIISHDDSGALFDKFYVEKTNARMKKFLERFDEKYFTQEYFINGKHHVSMKALLDKIDYKTFYKNPLYNLFHGDLQFDNILFDQGRNKFTYIDWRESFGGNTECGDLYYDLAKLYGGCIIPYNLTKKDSFVKCKEGVSFVEYEYETPKNLQTFKKTYEKWIVDKGFDLEKVKLITAIIFLNMSPLHSDNFSKMLWFKSIEILTDAHK